MSGALVLIKIAGFVALLLWGTHMVTSGVLRGFGGELRERIGGALSNTPRAFLAGVIATLALQSSTATGLMASSFAAQGWLRATPGFVLMLGANVGTALVTQIFAFPAVALCGPLFLLGHALFRKARSTRWKNIGRVSIGIGLMFLSLHELVATFRPLASLAVIRDVIAALGGQPLLAALLGALAAWVCHSSVAVVLLAVSLAAGGVLPLAAGLAVVLGANLGGAIPPALEVTGSVARRLPWGNLLVRAVGVAGGLVLLPVAEVWLQGWKHTGPRALVDMHVAFNLALALMALPWAGPLSRLLIRWLPEPPVPEDPGQPRYLDDSLVGQPHLALAHIEREALRLADLLAEQTRQAHQALLNKDSDAAQACGRSGDAITRLGPLIRQYICRVPSESVSEEEKQRLNEITVFVMNAEHVADLLPHHLVEPTLKRTLGGEALGASAQALLREVMGEIQEGLELAVSALMRRDLRAARALLVHKTTLRIREQAWVAGLPSTPVELGRSTVEMDIVLKALRECRRIYGHLGAIAYHLLEQAGQLRDRVADGEGN